MRLFARYRLLILLIGAAAIRLIVLLAFPDIFAFDQTGAIHGSGAFDTYAVNLLQTGVYGLTPGVPDAMLPPGYSYALAAVYALFGRSFLSVGIFHTVLDLLSITMLYEIGRRIFQQAWIGWIAGVLYAIYPYLIFQNLTLSDTALFMTLLYAFILALIMLRDRPQMDRTGWSLVIFASIILGAVTLVRPIVPPFAAFAGLWFLLRRPLLQTISRLAPVAIVSVMVIAPWFLRNYQVYGTFVSFSVTSGSNFWQGSSPDTLPYLRAGYDVQWTSPPDDLPNTPQGDRERVNMALSYLRENPAVVPDLLWTKFLTYWSVDVFPRVNPVAGVVPRLDYQGNPIRETDEAGNPVLGGLPQGDPVTTYDHPLFDQLGRVIHRWYFGILLLLSLSGIMLTFDRWRDVSLLWFVQIVMTIMYVAFHPSTRYRVPTDPLLFLFAAFTIYSLIAMTFSERETNVLQEVKG